MTESKFKSRRLSITIPKDDDSVLEWADCQINLSLSIRQAIREYIEKYGYVDALTRRVDKLPRRGRKPSNVSEVSIPLDADEGRLLSEETNEYVDKMTKAQHLDEKVIEVVRKRPTTPKQMPVEAEMAEDLSSPDSVRATFGSEAPKVKPRGVHSFADARRSANESIEENNDDAHQSISDFLAINR